MADTDWHYETIEWLDADEADRAEADRRRRSLEDQDWHEDPLTAGHHLIDGNTGKRIVFMRRQGP